jgi:hypothetical protein
VISLEQRLESFSPQKHIIMRQTLNMKKGGEKMMKGKNNSGAPKLIFNLKNTILVVIHVLFFMVSIVFHPPIENGSARTLP